MILTKGITEGTQVVEILTLFMIPIILIIFNLKSRKKNKKYKKTIFMLLLSIGFGLFVSNNSYYIITENNIYYKSIIKSHVYSVKDVNEIDIFFETSKKYRYCDIAINFKDGTCLKLNRQNEDFPRSDDFKKFSKSCVFAKKDVQKCLTAWYKDTLISDFGDQNANYIVQDYKIQ